MDRFHVVEDAAVILRVKSVFKQAKVFVRGDGVYAASSGGYVRLYAGGGTGVPSVSWDDIDLGTVDKSDLKPDAHGKLSLAAPIKTIEAK